jgi:hypothetical protein
MKSGSDFLRDSSLFKFKIGEREISIIVQSRPAFGKRVVLKTRMWPLIVLDLPVPYEKTSISTTWEKYDEVVLVFEVVAINKDGLDVVVKIRERRGYWYLGSLDEERPPFEETRKKLTIFVDEKSEQLFCGMEEFN